MPSSWSKTFSMTHLFERGQPEGSSPLPLRMQRSLQQLASDGVAAKTATGHCDRGDERLAHMVHDDPRRLADLVALGASAPLWSGEYPESGADGRGCHAARSSNKATAVSKDNYLCSL
ncbi:hypothetical protein WJX74_002272 [Apatococcus lobatus]|uniref:Uncharacterized protein n=1 Tax=Apatococcus lobatus TaxID=904363 RepID=A0AAW1QC79_9CHLO